MSHFDDDDQLITGAFADFNDAAAPTVSAVGTAPLHTKAIRHRRTRATLIGLASALIIALPVATYAALGQQNQGPPPMPGDSPTAGIETPTAVPSPSPSDSPKATQSAFSRAYFAVAVNNNVEVYAYKDGSATLHATIPDPSGTVKATITISPDETSLAWVEDGGALVVARIDGSQKETVLTGVSTAGKDAPMWTNGQRLVTDQGTVDIATKQMTITSKLKGEYQVISPGYQFIAYVPTAGPSRVVVEGADGTKAGEWYVPEGRRSVLALSPDGRYVAVGGWPTAGERETSWRGLIDTRTGRIVLQWDNLQGPKPGRFLTDGTFVLHDKDKMSVMKLDGTVVTTIPMPDALKVHDGPPALRYPVLLLVK